MTVILTLMVTTWSRLTGSEETPTAVLVENSRSLGLQQVRLRDRVGARMRTTRLDEQLADGVSPESNVVLALHAARLCREDQQHQLAVSLRRVAEAARGGRRTRVLIDRDGVRLALCELEEVATRLDSNELIDVSGIARVRSLLADGAGPLYRRSAPGQLRQELAAVLAVFEPSE